MGQDGSKKHVTADLDLDQIEQAADGKKTIRRSIWKLATPSLTEMVLTNFISMLNMIMVGRVGPAAVAAVGLTNVIVFMLLAVFFAINTGATAIVARSIGAGEHEEANVAAQQTFLLNVVLSIVIGIAAYLFTEPILVFMGAAPEVLADGVLYAQIIFLSLGFTAISMGLSAVLRGAGDTKTPAKVNVLSTVLTVALGFPLIYGYLGLPEMGVVGAAVSNLVARLTATVWVGYVLFGGDAKIKLRWKGSWRVDHTMVSRIVKIGLPAAGEQFSLRTGQLVLAKVVAGLGTITFAAHQIAFSVLGMTFMPGMAFALAAMTLVGQALGAQKPELAEKFGWETRRIGSIVATSIGVLFIVFAPYIMMMYTDDPRVIEQGAIALRVIGCVQLAQSTQFILAGALRGAGDTKFPLYATFVGVWGFRVVLTLLFVLGFEWGLLGAWLAIAVDQVVRMFIIYARYKRGKWKTLQV